MAGRGTDIQLGGNVDMLVRQQLEGEADEAKHEQLTQKVREEVAAGKQMVLDAGGVFIVGTERHESRRIDNQLRAGRAVRAIRADRNSSCRWKTT